MIGAALWWKRMYPRFGDKMEILAETFGDSQSNPGKLAHSNLLIFKRYKSARISADQPDSPSSGFESLSLRQINKKGPLLFRGPFLLIR
jgi:hypothetical protein